MHRDFSLKKTLGFFVRAASTAVLIIALLFGMFVVANVVLGYKSYVVISSSMSPMLNEGDLIFVKQILFEQLDVDDVITFQQPDSNSVVTHRISRIDSEGGKLYTTGDQNQIEDPKPIYFENIKGAYVYKIPGVGKWIE